MRESSNSHGILGSTLAAHQDIRRITVQFLTRIRSLSNRTDQWVRVIAIVAASDPNRVPIESNSSSTPQETKVLDDAWLA